MGEGVNRCLQFVLPQHLVPAMLAELHDSPTGHLGLKKVLEKVKRRFYWVDQQHDVQKWCGSCLLCCLRKSPPKHHHAPLQVETIVGL